MENAARPPRFALVCLLASGCMAGPGYPSLAPRAVESVSLAEPAAKPAAPATPQREADARYAPLLARARTLSDQFKAAVAESAPVLAAGRRAAIGSDAWSAAQQALSRLQALRGPMVEALTATQAAAQGPEVEADSGLAAAAQRALASVQALDAEEARSLIALAPANS
ncbi:hypothetical protein [Sphingomonas morindae]|uniref:Lipoprotein n=1 Tax=Sphingomonas morindae TaxID=1541170 RepID=A0ABY4X6G4_9SPHN|nr:hypothetical protein [Sphingomonas morindae]USI72508.1 hypothetical protein LHA26_14620 [Sphingomonas morindae]